MCAHLLQPREACSTQESQELLRGDVIGHGGTKDGVWLASPFISLFMGSAKSAHYFDLMFFIKIIGF